MINFYIINRTFFEKNGRQKFVATKQLKNWILSKSNYFKNKNLSSKCNPPDLKL